MRSIVIFEGIASSGKTTLEKMLAERLGDAAIFSEEETLMPVVDNKNKDVALKRIDSLLTRMKESKKEYLIIDRFHLTHAFRTSATLEDFATVEDDLRKAGHALVVLLTIDPEHIKKRIEETILHRKNKWKKGAQGSIEEKVSYYKKQQEILKSLLSKSSLPSLTVDTTQKTWKKYVDWIIEAVQ